MTCIRMNGMIVCVSPFYRLRLADGRCVFMEWHSFCGPTFYRDRNCRRMIEDWYEDTLICDAIDWFVKREYKA